MRILVLGAGGMAGHLVALYLREEGHEVYTQSAHNRLDAKTHLIDVTNLSKLKHFLHKHKYGVVVNSIGLLTKESESRKDLAVYLNAFLPHFLEQFYAHTKTRIIHLSTDCVFSGLHSPYKEDAPLDTGPGFYDRSKVLGEIKNDKDLTLRMSIVGPNLKKVGSGLFDWFWSQHGQISGYSKFVWSGITTLELAKGIQAAIEQPVSGIYHLVPKTAISKHGLLQLFKDVFGRSDLNIKADSSVKLDRTLLNTRRDLKLQVSDYATMVHEMKEWIDAHPSIYPHYL